MANVFRSDHIGPLVKPAALRAAERAFIAGAIDQTTLDAAREAAIADAIALQRDTVMTVISDGEMRRIGADSPFAERLEGLSKVPAPGDSSAQYAATGRLLSRRSMFTEEVGALRQRTNAAIKVGMPSPSSLAIHYFPPATHAAPYRSIPDLAAAFAEILRSELSSLIELNVPYLQFNAEVYHSLFESSGSAAMALSPAYAAFLFKELLAVDVALLKSVCEIAGLTVAVHVPRTSPDDGYRYERMASELFAVVPAQRFLLEYADSASPDFSSLRDLPRGKTAVLGLVSNDAPESIDELILRLEQAANFTSEDRLALSPRKGFKNPPPQDIPDELAAQRRCLVRTSEVVQQFWGLEL